MNGPIDTALLDDLLRTTTADGIRKHVVGAVIAGGDGRVLLLHRAADDYLGGLWELPSGGVDEREALPEALSREVEEETGLKVTAVGGYLGHFDYLSKSGRLTRQFNFIALAGGGSVALTEHDDHVWADRVQQEKASGAVRDVLASWRDRTTP